MPTAPRSPLFVAALLGAALLLSPAAAQERPGASLLKRYTLASQPGTRESELLVSQAAGGQLLRRISLGRGGLRLAAHPPTQRLYVLTRGDLADVWVIDTATDRVRAQYAALPGAADLALSGDGALLYLVGPGGVQTIDTSDGRELGLLPPPAGVAALDDIQPTDDGNRFLVRAALRDPAAKPQWLLLTPDAADGRGELKPAPARLPAASPGLRPSTSSPPRPARWHVARSGLAAELAGPPPAEQPAYGRQLLVGSKNRNYLLVVDPAKGAWQEAIPLDAGVDDLIVSADRTRAYAYHRALGQISYLHLKPNQPTTYSVFRRVQLPSFAAAGLQLTEQGNRIYLWDGRKTAVAAVDIYGLKVQPVLRPETLEVRLFRPIHHIQNSERNRLIYYVQDGKAYAEETRMRKGYRAPRTIPVPLAGEVAAVALSPDHRFLYVALPERGAVAVVNAVTLRTEAEVPVGKNPRDVIMSSESELAYVLNVGDASITTIDAQNRDVVKTWQLPGLTTPRTVRVLDQTNRALMQIHMPVYTDDGSLRIAPLP